MKVKEVVGLLSELDQDAECLVVHFMGGLYPVQEIDTGMSAPVPPGQKRHGEYADWYDKSDAPGVPDLRRVVIISSYGQ